jgi:hypothetical protein
MKNALITWLQNGLGFLLIAIIVCYGAVVIPILLSSVVGLVLLLWLISNIGWLVIRAVQIVTDFFRRLVIL